MQGGCGQGTESESESAAAGSWEETQKTAGQRAAPAVRLLHRSPRYRHTHTAAATISQPASQPAHLLGHRDEAGVRHPGAVVPIRHLTQLVGPHLVKRGLWAGAGSGWVGGEQRSEEARE